MTEMFEYLQIRKFETARACKFGNFQFSKPENFTLWKPEIFAFRASKIRNLARFTKLKNLEFWKLDQRIFRSLESSKLFHVRNSVTLHAEKCKSSRVSNLSFVQICKFAKAKFPPNLNYSFSMLPLKFSLITIYRTQNIQYQKQRIFYTLNTLVYSSQLATDHGKIARQDDTSIIRRVTVSR